MDGQIVAAHASDDRAQVLRRLRVLDALDSAGWIAEREGNARSVRVQINGKRSRLYAVRPDEGGEHES